MANWNQPNVDTLVARLHRHHPDLTIVGQPALPLEGDTEADYGRLTISSPTSPREYTLELRADGITLSVSPVAQEPTGCPVTADARCATHSRQNDNHPAKELSR